jgi:Mrp family chromosome partitioning ATPase
MNEVREELSKSFDYIIYDMPAVDSSMDAKVIAVSVDATILVSAIGKTSKKGIVDAANTLQEVKANLIGTIINKIDMDQYASLHKDYDYFLKEKYTGKKDRKAKR